ncbi:MAG TPA: hypothetical protein VEJ45_05225 [Candidatus Acidoferrales bacterium]|nr:hypothetical protein [Candidatus Acidoferrales bacterium]
MSSTPTALTVTLALTLLITGESLPSAAAQGMSASGQRRPTPTPKAGALIDLTGYWVSIIDEEWRWRMMTPPQGDFSFVPLNAEGRRVAGLWDPAADEAGGNGCKVYGAAGIMRLPERLHITWADDNTLAIDIDAGMQMRLLHFDGSKWRGGEPSWQGDSVASWEKQVQTSGFVRPTAGAAPPEGGSLKVVTTHMRPGYLRKNGVPYSGNAVLTEYFDRLDVDGQAYLIVTGIVEDPQFLAGRFITTEQFKLEPNGSKWNPTPCKIGPPTRAPARAGGF